MTGRVNVGKSSLLDAVLGRRDLLRTSKKAVWILSTETLVCSAQPDDT